jgi:hypothetical protein
MIPAVIISIAFLFGILYDLITNLPTNENIEFEKLLRSIEPTLHCNTLSLYNCDSLNYLNITYDFLSDVFVEFDMDMGLREIPTERQLEITRNYFNQYLNK